MLAELAGRALDWMRAQAPELDAEVFLSRSRARVLSRRGGARDGARTAEELGAAVRVARGGRMGFACAGGADLPALQALWRGARAQLDAADPDPAQALAAVSPAAPDAAFAASLWDEAVPELSWREAEALLARAEAAALETPGARVLHAELRLSSEETAVAGARGTLAAGRGSAADVSIVAVHGAGDGIQVGEGARGARRLALLDPEAAGREAARRAAAGAGARRPRAGRRAVLFEPWVGAELLELLAGLFCADEVQGRRSLLAGRLGSAVASPLVTLRDDPRRPGGPASAAFDDEGVATRDKAMLERGVLRELFHDAATAARERVPPNGCAWRGGWAARPAPGPSNFYLAPDGLERGKLISDTGDGLLVLEMLGAHTADPVSGEFSVGISGFELERGAQARPFQGAMLSGNLLDLLGRVDAVADDLVFYGSFGAPTFRVSALDVA